jgi:hypothetical protein
MLGRMHMRLLGSERLRPFFAKGCSRGRLLGSLALALVLLARSSAGDPVVFSVFGDVPYNESELAVLQTHVTNHNRYSPSAFLVHVGDIKSASEVCQEVRYQDVADALKGSAVPVFILPGDNEWVDCSNPSQGWSWWMEHLFALEKEFCGIWPVDAQIARPENFAFVRDGVLFVGLNYVAGGPSSVTQADADWVNAQFATFAGSARAAVILAQKKASGILFDAVKTRGHAFGKPVLYMHGDGHDWEHDPAFFGEPNMLRVQVERGSSSHPPVQVTVTSAGQFQFDEDPWPAGTPEIVRNSCGGPQPTLSIDDLFVTEGQSANFTVTLSGATGDPASVNYATQDDTARAGSDYAAMSGSLSFSGTTTQRQIQVATSQDSTGENAESFFVNLSNASGAAIAKAQGGAVILDDDPGYTVTVQPTAGGSVTLSPSGGVYAAGTLITVTAVPAAGYRFGSWGGALSGTGNPTPLLVNGNKTISATFIRRYTVSVSASGAGSISLSPSGGVYDAGTLVTLTAVPVSGGSFLGWGGALSGTSNPTPLLVDGNKSVTASFTRVHTLTVSTRGKGSVTLVPPGGAYVAGTVVTLTAVPAPGFTFRGWLGALWGLANPTTLVIDRNKSVTAIFKK